MHRPRSATIEVEQLGTGYWHATVTIRIPGAPDQSFDSSDLLHTADDALDWARMTIENVVAAVR